MASRAGGVVLKSVGLTDEATNAILVEALGAGFPLEAVRDRERQYLDDTIEAYGPPLKPGLLDLLDYDGRAGSPESRRKFLPTPHRRTHGIVGRLAERIGAMAGGDEVAHGKPAPDIFLLAAQRLGVAGRGMPGARGLRAWRAGRRAAGMIPILVPDLKPPSPEGAALAYRVLPSLHDVKELLQHSWYCIT